MTLPEYSNSLGDDLDLHSESDEDDAEEFPAMGQVDENDNEGELSEEDTTPKQSQVDMLLGKGFKPSKSQPLSAPVVQHATGDDDSVTGISDS
jgi:hypothetical protein